ncbi:DNA-methyltransferase [Streptomyces mirabilis]|uniref:DNA-methyltransferase n=1 Tax=Streptomyces mirabilis TaxID=68239 RepID=UPI0033D8B0D3
MLLGDALEQLRTLPDGSVDCIVTSPPYFGLRDYGTPGQYGLEATPAAYVETMRTVFAEARRVLAEEGTLWLNLGDSYAYPPGSAGRQGDGQRKGRTFTAEGLHGTIALPPKNLLMIPERVAMAFQDDGWILRNKIVWNKTNAMPASVTDRFSNRYEHLFLFTQAERYWFDLEAVKVPVTGHAQGKAHSKAYAQALGTETDKVARRFGINETTTLHQQNDLRNPGDVWSIPTRPYTAAHFAVFPIDLPLRCIKAGCKPGGTVLDPFSGSGTTGAAARQLGRKYVGIDLNPAYHDLAKERFAQGVLDFDASA